MGPIKGLTTGVLIALAAVLPGCATLEPAEARLESLARVDPADPSRYVQLGPIEAAGAAAVFRQGQRFDARLGMPLRAGDEVETGDAAAVIWFAAYGTVVLAERTRVRIGSLEVLFGRVFADIRGLFSASSENVVAGVEGTAFAFEVRPDRAVRIVVLDGVVACRSKTASWPPVRMRAQQALFSQYPNRTPPRVEVASQRELEALRAWAVRVRNATPPPRPPTPLGWCCDRGRVSYLRADQCGGAFYGDQASAQQACAPPQMGYCCDRGRVSYLRADQCGGAFYGDQASAQQACAVPLPPPGWCCDKGRVSYLRRDQCPGSFYGDQASAQKACAVPLPPPGWCCDKGRVSYLRRDQCPGSFYGDQASAQRACAPPMVWCCDKGKVSYLRRDQCGGASYGDQASAQKACAPPMVWCCDKGKVSYVRADQCGGSSYRDQASATKACQPILRTPTFDPRRAPPAAPVVR
jgi:hypothetical protein